MVSIRNLIVAGVAIVLLSAQPTWAQDSVDSDLKTIYQGIYSLYEKAENGDPRAAFYVASLHLTGVFLPADPKAGVKFLEMAAEKENADALYYLGLHHRHGMYDYDIDKEKGAEMIRKAAELGQPAAKLALQHLDAQ